MGQSNTGQYGEGRTVHHPDAAWPQPLRERWSMILEGVAVDPLVVSHLRAVASSPPKPLNDAPARVFSVLRTAGLRRPLRRLAAKGIDEADAARIWAASPHEEPEKARAWASERVRALRAVEAAVVRETGRALGGRRRLPKSTRVYLRAQLVRFLVSDRSDASPTDTLKRVLGPRRATGSRPLLAAGGA